MRPDAELASLTPARRAPLNLSPPLLMALASLLFAAMGVGVKWASTHYHAGEIVLYRSLVGLVMMAAVMRLQGVGWRTTMPGMHLWRSACGTTALCLWFVAIGGLPLATAMTLNAMSSVWIALFVLAGSVLMGGQAVDQRLMATVFAGFAGVALVLRPTLAQDQLWFGLIGLASGVLAAVAYVQVTALGRAGEPGERVVLYFCASGVLAGAGLTWAQGGLQAHPLQGLPVLMGIGVLATVAQWMMTRAFGRGATLGVAALQYLGIGFSFVFGVLIFGDPVTGPSLAGMMLIVAAGVAATWLHPRGAASEPV
jgi:S-adenosylmethionine uptake transporter